MGSGAAAAPARLGLLTGTVGPQPQPGGGSAFGWSAGCRAGGVRGGVPQGRARGVPNMTPPQLPLGAAFPDSRPPTNGPYSHPAAAQIPWRPPSLLPRPRTPRLMRRQRPPSTTPRRPSRCPSPPSRPSTTISTGRRSRRGPGTTCCGTACPTSCAGRRRCGTSTVRTRARRCARSTRCRRRSCRWAAGFGAGGWAECRSCSPAEQAVQVQAGPAARLLGLRRGRGRCALSGRSLSGWAEGPACKERCART